MREKLKEISKCCQPTLPKLLDSWLRIRKARAVGSGSTDVSLVPPWGQLQEPHFLTSQRRETECQTQRLGWIQGLWCCGSTCGARCAYVVTYIHQAPTGESWLGSRCIPIVPTQVIDKAVVIFATKLYVKPGNCCVWRLSLGEVLG